jgi:hypothetical protein
MQAQRSILHKRPQFRFAPAKLLLGFIPARNFGFQRSGFLPQVCDFPNSVGIGA